jgi:hypothetical protein
MMLTSQVGRTPMRRSARTIARRVTLLRGWEA